MRTIDPLKQSEMIATWEILNEHGNPRGVRDGPLSEAEVTTVARGAVRQGLGKSSEVERNDRLEGAISNYA